MKKADIPATYIKSVSTPVVFISLTINNNRALEPICQHLSKHLYTLISPERFGDYFPPALVAKYSFRYLFPLVWAYIKASEEERLNMRGNFYEFFSTMGHLKIVQRLLDNSNIRMIVLANDHSSPQKSFTAIAKEKNIPVLYTQHCSVTERFPELQFPYSFLDGRETLQKYSKIGNIKGTIYLSGNPRYDRILSYKERKRHTKNIGIALNHNDNIQRIHELCEVLLANGYHDIIVRPHPGESIDASWYLERNIMISDSNVENSLEFISNISCLIAGESGIHLDAAMLEVSSVCYGFSKNQYTHDWYSYIKNGLMPYYETPEAVVNFLQTKVEDNVSHVKEISKWYNAAVETMHNGHIGEMIADFIIHFQNNDIVSFNQKYGFVESNVYGVNVMEYKN